MPQAVIGGWGKEVFPATPGEGGGEGNGHEDCFLWQKIL